MVWQMFLARPPPTRTKKKTIITTLNFRRAFHVFHDFRVNFHEFRIKNLENKSIFRWIFQFSYNLLKIVNFDGSFEYETIETSFSQVKSKNRRLIVYYIKFISKSSDKFWFSV